MHDPAVFLFQVINGDSYALTILFSTPDDTRKNSAITVQYLDSCVKVAESLGFQSVRDELLKLIRASSSELPVRLSLRAPEGNDPAASATATADIYRSASNEGKHRRAGGLEWPALRVSDDKHVGNSTVSIQQCRVPVYRLVGSSSASAPAKEADSIEDISLNDFEARFARMNQPVILRGLLEDRPCKHHAIMPR
jgi:hypothetical protein